MRYKTHPTRGNVNRVYGRWSIEPRMLPMHSRSSLWPISDYKRTRAVNPRRSCLSQFRSRRLERTHFLLHIPDRHSSRHQTGDEILARCLGLTKTVATILMEHSTHEVETTCFFSMFYPSIGTFGHVQWAATAKVAYRWCSSKWTEPSIYHWVTIFPRFQKHLSSSSPGFWQIEVCMKNAHNAQRFFQLRKNIFWEW